MIAAMCYFLTGCTVNRYIVIVQPRHECPELKFSDDTTVPFPISQWGGDPGFFKPINTPFPNWDVTLTDTLIFNVDTSIMITEYKNLIPR